MQKKNITQAVSIFFAFCASIVLIASAGQAPWPSFYGELGFGFAFIFLLLLNKRSLLGRQSIDTTALISLLLIIPLAISVVKNKFPYLGVFFISASYVSAFIGTLLLANALQNKKSHFINGFLFFYFILSCSFLFLLQILQLLNIENSFAPPNSGRLSASIGQPNILATFFVLGIAGIIHLAKEKQLQKTWLIFIAIFCLGIGFTQSRTGLLNLLIGSLVFFALRERSVKKLVLSWLTIAITWLGAYAVLTQSGDLGASLRNIETGAGRLEIWKMSIHSIFEKPWAGFGIGQISIAQYESPYFLPGRAVLGYSHNILLDLVLWFGLFFGIIFSVYLLTIIALSARNSLKTQSSTAVFFAALAISIHALLEAPHSYAYLLIPLAAFLGSALSHIQASQKINIDGRILLLIPLLAIIPASIIFKDYSKIQSAIHASQLRAQGQDMPQEELSPQSFIAFDHWQDFLRRFYTDPDTDVSQLKKLEALAALLPNNNLDASVIYTLQESGQDSAAVFRLMKACSMEPQDACDQLKALPFIGKTVRNKDAYCANSPLSQSDIVLSQNNTPLSACY